MKLDTKAMRHLTAEDWRVLTAVEMGSKNHELVPTPLIDKIARLRGGSSGVHKSIAALAKAGLVARVKEARYDGYRLTYGGLDYLALHAHASRRDVYSVGSRIGVGKESDIVMVADEAGVQRVLKIHRLGRVSFRTVKANRDYLRNRAAGSWMYLSRLSATREFAFMRVLREEGFPVPEPLAHSRHTVLMSFVDAFPLRQISAVPDPSGLYAELLELILRLARHGLIHGDFNEFNILIREEKNTVAPARRDGDGDEDEDEDKREDKKEEGSNGSDRESTMLTPIIIDFPQMVSMDHANAEMYFDRDVNCIKRFFERRFHFVGTQPGPFFKDAKKLVGADGARRLDAAVEASGFTKKMAKDLETAIREQAASKGDEISTEDVKDEEEEGEGDEEEEAEKEDDDDDDEEEEEEEEENKGVDNEEPLHSEFRGGDDTQLNRLEGLVISSGS